MKYAYCIDKMKVFARCKPANIAAAACISLLLSFSFSKSVLADSTDNNSSTTVNQKLDKTVHKAEVKKSDSYTPLQTKVINSIPGPKVSPDDLKQEKVEKGPGLNPIGWLFRPVTKLEAQSVRLEQQIMKLTGPIAALQPAMLGLDQRMDNVNGEMKVMKTEMGNVEGRMENVKGEMVSVKGQMLSVQDSLKKMRDDIHLMRGDMTRLQVPIRDLQAPIAGLKKPVQELAKPVSTIGQRMDTLDSQMHDLKMILSLVLSSIYVAAALIAIGTPLAAIVVWKHRQKLLKDQSPPPTPPVDFKRRTA